MTIRMVRAVAVLVALVLLPAALAGCAAAVADHGQRGAAEARRQPLPSETPVTSGPTPGENRWEIARATPGAPGMSYLVPRQSMPSPHEELWVIQKRPAAERVGDPQTPGGGSMVVPRGDQLVPIPLKHTDVKANIAGHIATVDVVQQFQNPFDGKIEAVYVFPVPHDASVTEFLMTVGERRIRGIVREREEAKQIYAQAKRQGYVASLLDQDRPNVFTQRVANIEPGKRIDVSVRYFHTLSYGDGWYEWVFPMVVGPRFNPPGSVDGIGATGRGSRGASRQKSEVKYLGPAERSGHDVALSVKLDALVPVEAVESRTHRIAITRPSPGRAEVALEAVDAIANRDFVLRWKVAGGGIKSGLVVQPGDDGGGYFTMTIVPPADARQLPRSPVEMVFALDVSGSMNGRPIEQATAAVRWALAHLRPDDTFQIVRFASRAEGMVERPLVASPENVRRAKLYLETTSAAGGTMMLEGLRKALDGPADESRQRYVVFLTDGYIGNEAEILGALQRSIGGSRVFAMGVGSAPNRYLLEHMAKLGRGAVAYLGAKDNAEDVMAEYFGAISHPALTDLAIDFAAAGATEVYPERLPDLFVGRPVTVVGRLRGEAPPVVRVTGKLLGEARAVEAAVTRAAADEKAPAAALPAVWARMKIADLAEKLAVQPNDSGALARLRQVATEYGLMSAYTSFVAVDSLTRTRGDHGTTVATPVPVPDGVRYETTARDGG